MGENESERKIERKRVRERERENVKSLIQQNCTLFHVSYQYYDNWSKKGFFPNKYNNGDICFNQFT